MRGRRHKLQVSTFPFLAVLLCAMGSLILVLLVMDRMAHKAAQARAQRQATELAEESARSESARQAETEQRKQQARKEWEKKRDALHDKLTREQIEMQLQMRKVREELQGIAARLHYEQDTTTQLRHKAQDERSRLQAEEQLLATLRSNAKQTENQSKESSQALRRMTLDLLQIEQVLKDLKAAKQREQKTFSVVPYHGRRGESRRPLYVECTANGVIFHPERKAMSVSGLLSHSDDSGSDVRAEVERRILQQRQKLAGLPSNADKTPYLLLLLRPSGVTTYHLLQTALRGLPLDFGYEFIDEDWVLDFPADDELPSTQPWMSATKTASRPSSAPPPSVAASPPRTSPRPVGGSPMGQTAGAFRTGIRGFLAGEAGNGSWVKGDVNQSSTPTNGTGGGAGGTGPAMAGGGGNWSGTRPLGNGAAGPLADARGSTYPNRGSGHGHPSAMPPSLSNGEGGNDSFGQTNSGQVSASGSGFRGGLFPMRGSNSGSASGGGYQMDGPAGEAGSDMPGLGPPRALSYGSGGSYSGSGTGPGGSPGTGAGGSGFSGNTGPGGMAGTGAGGSGFPGNGWAGGGTAGPGIPGSTSGMRTSADGRYVIARGNNNGDAPGSALFNGGGGGGAGGAGTGGPGLPGAGGSGGSSPGTGGNYGPNFGGQGQGGSPSGSQSNGGQPGGQGTGGTPMPNSLAGGGTVPGSQLASQLPGSQSPLANTGSGSSPGPQGSGGSYGGPTVIGGAANGQAGPGGPMSPGGGRSSDVVIFVDPVTGQPTEAPRPTPSPNDASAQGAPPEDNDGKPGPRRIRVVPVTSATSGGSPGSGNAVTESMNRLAPTPSYRPPPPPDG